MVIKRKVIDLTKTKKKKTKKPVKKKKVVKKKAKKPVKKKQPVRRSRYSQPYIGQNTFTPKELERYVSTLKKLKQKKRTVKQKKVGLTNMVSMLNLLHNVDQEKRNLPRRNLMVAHAFKYPSLIQDVDVNAIWKATSLPSRGTKNAIISNLNDIYRHLVGYNLLNPSSSAAGTRTDPVVVE